MDTPPPRVDEEPLETAEAEAELVRLRRGPRAALLPVAASSQGRQLRRWVTQSLEHSYEHSGDPHKADATHRH